MKSKSETIYDFFSTFGLPTYEQSAIPTGDNAPTFPFLTYVGVTGDLWTEANITCDLWYRDSSWADADEMADTISEAIGLGGVMLPVIGGAIWIKRGQPFAQNMGDPNDNMIKRKYINITAEFITAD